MTQTIVYSSRLVLPVGSKLSDRPIWLDELVQRSNIKNRITNITGMLSYKEGKVLQLIEGEPEQLGALYATIMNDERHENIRTLLDIEDSQRAFSDWGMVSEGNLGTSIPFRDFLYIHFDELVEMTDRNSDELMFFI